MMMPARQRIVPDRMMRRRNHRNDTVLLKGFEYLVNRRFRDRREPPADLRIDRVRTRVCGIGLYRLIDCDTLGRGLQPVPLQYLIELFDSGNPDKSIR